MPPPGWRVDGRVHCFSVPMSNPRHPAGCGRAGSSRDAGAIRPRESVWEGSPLQPLAACMLRGNRPRLLGWPPEFEAPHCPDTARCILSPVLGRCCHDGDTLPGSSGAATQVRMIRWGSNHIHPRTRSPAGLCVPFSPALPHGGACHEIPRVWPPYSAGAAPRAPTSARTAAVNNV